MDRNHAIIDFAVKLHDKNLLILSEDSVDRDWVENEYNAVVEREIKEGRNLLVLISPDGAVKNTAKNLGWPKCGDRVTWLTFQCGGKT